MKKFDASSYDDVNDRIKKFYSDNVDGRIITTLIESGDLTVFKVEIYMNLEDQKLLCPKAVGYAKEIRDLALKVTSEGKPYESVNYTSWLENCETSAIGRALANAGYSGSKRPSRQEMESVHQKLSTNTGDVMQNLGHKVQNGEVNQKCNKCGSTMAWSEKKQKLYCSALCWKKDVGQTSEFGTPDDINYK